MKFSKLILAVSLCSLAVSAFAKPQEVKTKPASLKLFCVLTKNGAEQVGTGMGWINVDSVSIQYDGANPDSVSAKARNISTDGDLKIALVIEQDGKPVAGASFSKAAIEDSNVWVGIGGNNYELSCQRAL